MPEPRQPCRINHADDVGQRRQARAAPLADRNQAERLGGAHGALSRAARHASQGGDGVNRQDTDLALVHFPSDDG